MKKTLLAVSFLAAATVFAAHIGYLYPAGGRAGSTVEVLVGGSGLGNISSASVSGGGVKVVKVKRVGSIPFISGSQLQYVRRWIQELAAGKKEPPHLPSEEVRREWRKAAMLDRLSELTPLEMEIVMRKVFVREDSLQKSPSIGQLAIITLEIATDAAPGRREMRLFGRGSISDPLPFFVDKLPEICEPRFEARPGQSMNYKSGPVFKEPPRTPFVKLPAVLNGRIFPGETDTFFFNARRGEKLTFKARGRALVPFLGDGVPGHFQMVLEICDVDGKVVASADDHYFDPDPVLFFRAPHTGVFRLKVRDALFRGRDDFVYRINVTRGAPAPPQPVLPPSLRDKEWVAASADSEVALPACLKVVLAKPNEVKRYRFAGKKDMTVVVEVAARRLGSPLDTRIALRDEAGKILAECDDVKDPLIGTTLHQADPRIMTTLPADGVYTLEIADASGTGCPAGVALLRISEPQPDFELYAYPSGIAAAPGNPTLVHILAVRKDGFAGRIVLGTPPDCNFSIVGVNALEPGMDRAVFTLSARGGRPVDPPSEVNIVGFSGPLARRVRGADEAMQAFAYTHLVPAERMMGVVRWGAGGADRLRMVDSRDHVLLVPDGTAEIKLWRRPFKVDQDHKLDYTLAAAPKGVTIERVNEEDGNIVTVTLRASKDAPAYLGNATIKAEFSEFDKQKNKMRKMGAFHLPAFRIEVKK